MAAMRTALLTKRPQRTRISATPSFPAPIGGWNARESLAAMKPTEAVYLENLFPSTSYVELRGGMSSFATGTTGNVKTLAVYNKMGGTSNMYAYTASGIYDVSSAGAVGASKLTRTDGKHQWTMFGDGTNSWLIAVNGVDKPAYYDGTTWTAVDGATTPALTGLTTTNIIGVSVFKGRLIFIEKSSLSFWYLTAGAAGGALSEFDLSGECAKGGYLMATGSWTRDAGSGPDDFFVAVTSEGEAIVYQGTNPNSSTTWAKVGSFVVGKPLGRRCLMQYGGELLVLTEQGAFPMSALLMSGDERAKFALSFNIQDAFASAARSYGSTFGWKSITLPERNALFVNVPIAEDGDHEQYVMNMITKAWCKFTNWDAEDLAVFNGDLYFADGTAVYLAWSGTADNGNNIIYRGKQAFQDFKNPLPKHPKAFMPILQVNGAVTYSVGLDVDFEDAEIGGSVSFGSGGSSVWDTATWDSAVWNDSALIVRQWTSAAANIGRWIAPKLHMELDSISGQWIGSSIIYEQGNGL